MLTAGARLGPYEIVAPLGAGGMLPGGDIESVSFDNPVTRARTRPQGR